MNKHSKRKSTPKFKFKFALEALQQKQTLAQITSKYELHVSQISDWKQQVLTTGGGLFESGKSTKLSSVKADNSDKLYEQIGRLQVKNTFLKKVIVNFNTTQRLEMIEDNHEDLSINRRCNITQSQFYGNVHRRFVHQSSI
jgi:transposase